jgi:hypothetical protein
MNPTARRKLAILLVVLAAAPAVAGVALAGRNAQLAGDDPAWARS